MYDLAYKDSATAMVKRVFSIQHLLHMLSCVGETNIFAHLRRRYRNLTPFFILTHSLFSVLIVFPFSHKLFLPASTVHSQHWLAQREPIPHKPKGKIEQKPVSFCPTVLQLQKWRAVVRLEGVLFLLR